VTLTAGVKKRFTGSENGMMSNHVPLCASCNGESTVIDSRPATFNGTNLHGIRRRRMCLDCDERWTTYELRVSDLKAVKSAAKGARELGKALQVLADT